MLFYPKSLVFVFVSENLYNLLMLYWTAAVR